eukprot:CAMPEP_0202861244 /NCGR_PEP_ID=MMETSP1391-20130828/2706_1 /ASSEMBLY_ACC=CAM_ASM_000867 /TAXON_ID=1034604 /ORGANISM="Chlamydomonas leiostraca, Strain SAG 11-49" /LENGTH=171 /DNA_ID=CAMNT_0049540601 /DNA_START=89 /DNA_END=605 /DNA_ORIENTATION=-
MSSYLQQSFLGGAGFITAGNPEWSFTPTIVKAQTLLMAAASAAEGFQEELRVVHAALTEGQYHAVADATMDALHDKLEAFVEEQDIDGSDVEYGQGVLTVKLGRHGTYVINKQTPNRQIWLSSPVSGPFRFDWVPGQGSSQGTWQYYRDRRELVSQLREEIEKLLGVAPPL